MSETEVYEISTEPSTAPSFDVGGKQPNREPGRLVSHWKSLDDTAGGWLCGGVTVVLLPSPTMSWIPFDGIGAFLVEPCRKTKLLLCNHIKQGDVRRLISDGYLRHAPEPQDPRQAKSLIGFDSSRCSTFRCSEDTDYEQFLENLAGIEESWPMLVVVDSLTHLLRPKRRDPFSPIRFDRPTLTKLWTVKRGFEQIATSQNCPVVIFDAYDRFELPDPKAEPQDVLEHGVAAHALGDVDEVVAIFYCKASSGIAVPPGMCISVSKRGGGTTVKSLQMWTQAAA
ncbi:MAG TPA: hypothetical protein VHV55_20725 [Pirellulales bacterium]|jgi:hypothetical protein|nr:hypothetical protein [Pirellulales bacterium]